MSITSSTEVCNLALDLLSAGTVQDVDNPTTATEEQLNRWYDQSRRKLLREHPWNFATKRTILAADTETPSFGYASQFSLPSDFIRVLALSSNLSVDQETLLPREAYQVEGNKILLNDYYGSADAVRLIYVYDFTTVSQMDPMFINLLAHEIALSLSYKMTESSKRGEAIAILKDACARMSKSIDGQERPPTRVERSRNLTARRRSGSTQRSDRIVF